MNFSKIVQKNIFIQLNIFHGWYIQLLNSESKFLVHAGEDETGEKDYPIKVGSTLAWTTIITFSTITPFLTPPAICADCSFILSTNLAEVSLSNNCSALIALWPLGKTKK